MASNHWAKSMPYLVPNWNGVGEDDRHERQTPLEANHHLGVGGIGVFNEVSHNEVRKCNYVTKNTSLPFYFNQHRRPDPHPFMNTLCFSNSKRMFSYNNQNIRSFQLSLEQSRFTDRHERFSFDTDVFHQFSYEQYSRSSPFFWKSSNFKQHPCNEPILDLKIYDYNERLVLMTYSPSLLKIYNCDQDGNLNARVTYGSDSELFQLGEELETCDMNFDFEDLLLINFRRNNVVFTYDSEYDKIIYQNQSINGDIEDNRNHLIGVNWTENHNPFLYFFGTHRELFVGDIREIESRKLTEANNKNIRNLELFHSMIPNPVEGNQLIVATDLNVIFYDMRFPKKNIFQFRHMIDSQLVRKLHGKHIKINGSPRLMLFMSNYTTCALATLDVSTCFQPIMKHSLVHVNIPNDIGKIFPFLGTSDLLISGAQIVPGTLPDSPNTNDIFSLFLNLSNGDIYSQEFFVTEDDYVHPGKDMLESSFYHNLYAEQFDPSTLNYLKSVENFSTTLVPTFFRPSFTNPNGLFDPYLIEKEMALLNVKNKPDIMPANSSTPTLEYRSPDPVDFDAMLDLWKKKPNLRKNFRELTCRITDHLVDSIEKIQSQQTPDNTAAASSTADSDHELK